MKNAKRVLSILLSLMLVLGSVAVGGMTASAASQSFDQEFEHAQPEAAVYYFKVDAVRGSDSSVETVYLKAERGSDDLAVYESSDPESLKNVFVISENFEGSWTFDSSSNVETWTISLSSTSYSGIESFTRVSADGLSNEAKLIIGDDYAIYGGEIEQSSSEGWSVSVNGEAVTLNLDGLELERSGSCISAEYLDLTITGSAKLTSTASSSSPISSFDSNLTLNGNFILRAKCASGGALSIYEGNLIIEGGSLDVINIDDSLAIYVYGTMTVNGGSVCAKTESDEDESIAVVDTMIVNGGSVYAKTESENHAAIYTGSGITLNNDEYFALGDRNAKEVIIKEPGTYIKGDIIEYGTYPQSEVKDETILAALNAKVKDSKWISYGYYYSDTFDAYGGNMQPGDFMKYYDTMLDGVKYRAVTFTGYRPQYTKDTLSAGNSYQDDNGYYVSDESNTNIYWFRFDPVEWRVLDPDTGLILCSSIIDSQPFSKFLIYSYQTYGYKPCCDEEETLFATDFANSSIRQWLNNDFMNTAFSFSQQENILLSEDLAGAGEVYYDSGIYNYGPTSDKIFLLSDSEIRSMTPVYQIYYISDDFRLSASDYAKCQGLDCTNYSMYSELEGFYYWWTRSPYEMAASFARLVSPDGTVSGSEEVDSTCLGVVPAMRLNELKSDPTGAPIRAAIPEGAEETYDNTEHTGVEIDDGYALSGTVTATDVGEYTATATLEDGYIWKDGTTEDKEITWKITPKSITADMIMLSPDTAEYNGGEITPEVTVKDGEKVLTKDTDYTVIYSNNVNASENAKVTVTGKGNYKDSADKLFTISPADVTVSIKGNSATEDYDGSEKSATGYTVTASNSLYDVENDIEFSGTAEAKRTEPGNESMGLDASQFSNKNANFNATFTVEEDGKLTVNPVIKFVNEDGTELQSGAVAYGETPEYKGETPAKAASDGNTYEFAGWSPEITEATANATYTATYKSNAIGLALGEIEDSTGYKEDQTFTVDTSSLPEGAEIHWFVNGEDVGTGESYTVEDPTDDYTIQAKAVDKDGNTLDETQVQPAKVRNGFLDKLKWFFSDFWNNIFKAVIDAIIKAC